MYANLYASYGRGQLPTKTLKEAYETIPASIRATFMPGYGSIGATNKPKNLPGKGRGKHLTKLSVSDDGSTVSHDELKSSSLKDESDNLVIESNSEVKNDPTNESSSQIPGKELTPSKNPETPVNQSSATTTRSFGRGRARSTSYKPKPGSVVATVTKPVIPESTCTYRERAISTFSSQSSRLSNSQTSVSTSSIDPKPDHLYDHVACKPTPDKPNPEDIDEDESIVKSLSDSDTTLLTDDVSNIENQQNSSINDSVTGDNMTVLSKMLNKIKLNESGCQATGPRVGMDKSELLDTAWIKVSNIPTHEIENIVNQIEGSFYDCIPFYGELEEIARISESEFKIKFKYRGSSDSFVDAFQNCDCFSADVPIICERLAE